MTIKLNNPHKLSCHCGSVELEIEFPDGEPKDLRRCSCSICARRGAVMASVKLDELKIVKNEEDALRRYQFNTMTAEHYFCSKCGIYTHHKRRSDPNTYGINVAALEGVDLMEVGVVRMNEGWRSHPSDKK